ncbi:MAG: hypothetical protein AABY07_00555 [Nanoarchaeota archaeon]
MSTRLDRILEREHNNRVYFWRVGCFDRDGVGSSIFTDDKVKAINFAVEGINKRLRISVEPEIKYLDEVLQN